jgi:Mor family transcriptional regulator
MILGIAETIGVDGALKLMERFGGTPLYVPVEISPADPLARCLGIESARLLAERFKREQIYIPTGARARRVVRDRDIVRRHAAGETHAALARRFNLSSRRIQSILAYQEQLEC